MEKLTLEKLRNNEFSEDVANYGDCYQLAYSEGDKKARERGYAIYKFPGLEEVYVMVLKDETSLNPPVILSEEKALFLLNNPDEAKKYAFNVWLNRYR